MDLGNAESTTKAEYKTQFQTFLQADKKDSKYNAQLLAMMQKLETRFIININDLRTANRALAENIVHNPIIFIPIIESTLRDIVMDVDSDYFNKVAKHRKMFMNSTMITNERTQRIAVGFDGNFGTHQVTPRLLHAEHLSKLVCIEGIVTRCSIVRPKLMRTVHYCPKTNEFLQREFRDATELIGLPTGTVYPTKDDTGNLLETEFGLSQFKDSQSFCIQEMPEAAPLGQLPRSIDIMVDTDLVDVVKPGDRVAVIGVYRALSNPSAGSVSTGMFKTVLLAENIRKLGKDSSNVRITPADVSNIAALARTGDAFDLIARSLAPSIYGHKYIKQALTLLLLGGVEHNLVNGTHIRGDINILMVGDPSTAKSQLLRFVLNIAPVAVNTTGRGSSGVGLTAAVSSDPETGERRLEAGAMVLADRGVVCIDEFDKMSDADRVAIHEVMEQQTVTIAKAGIQASLNARCSVVAAANPIYGRFDNSLPLVRNVSLPDSLLSRFDLVFIVRDTVNKETDKKLADHVLRMHRFQRPGSEGKPIPLDAKVDDHVDEDDRANDPLGATPMWQKYNPILHGGAAQEIFENNTEQSTTLRSSGGNTQDTTTESSTGTSSLSRGGSSTTQQGGPSQTFDLLTLEFIRKFITFARNTVRPELSDAARMAIVSAYEAFRQNTIGRATVVTARSLETLIRLSSAHARTRLSNIVSRKDVQRAVTIMQYSLYADSGKQRNSDKLPSVVSYKPTTSGGGNDDHPGGGGGPGGGPGDGGSGGGKDNRPPANEYDNDDNYGGSYPKTANKSSGKKLVQQKSPNSQTNKKRGRNKTVRVDDDDDNDNDDDDNDDDHDNTGDQDNDNNTGNNDDDDASDDGFRRHPKKGKTKVRTALKNKLKSRAKVSTSSTSASTTNQPDEEDEEMDNYNSSTVLSSSTGGKNNTVYSLDKDDEEEEAEEADEKPTQPSNTPAAIVEYKVDPKSLAHIEFTKTVSAFFKHREAAEIKRQLIPYLKQNLSPALTKLANDVGWVIAMLRPLEDRGTLSVVDDMVCLL